MQTRNLILDSFKVLLACMVVGLHSGFLNDISQAGNFLTVNGVFRIAVPIFFIINGYYFASISSTERLIKWVKRVFYLYACWMLFYAYFWFRPSSFSFIELIKFVKNLVIGYWHLWYLPGMIGAGILTFLFKGKVRLGIALSFICFVLGVSIQYLGNYHVFSAPILDKLANMTFIHRNFLFLGFPFFYMGFVIKNNGLFKETNRKLLLTVSILGAGLLLGESWYNYSNPQNDGGFDNYLSLGLICPSLVLFAMRSKLTTEGKNLALISTAIYFIHPFWVLVVHKFTVLGGTTTTFSCILLSVLSSFLLIKVQKKEKFRLSFIL